MSAPRIVGLDLSFTKAGIAHPDGTTERIKGPPTSRPTYERLFRHATNVVAIVKRDAPDLVVIEEYAPRSRGILSTIRGAEVGGLVRASLWRLGVTFELIKPNELKQYATGRGNADKLAMIEAARARGAQWLTTDDDDEADAYLLRLMALDATLGRTGGGDARP